MTESYKREIFFVHKLPIYNINNKVSSICVKSQNLYDINKYIYMAEFFVPLISPFFTILYSHAK